MTTTPYDDPVAFDRRWSRLTPDERRIQADLDPLLFVADHVSIRDRREGSLAIHADLGPYGPPMMLVIADGPVAPDDVECLTLLHSVVDRISQVVADSDEELRDVCPVWALGVIHHRRGQPSINGLDRRWHRAVEEAAAWCGARSLGIIARTRDGAIVRLRPSDSDEPALTQSADQEAS